MNANAEISIIPSSRLVETGGKEILPQTDANTDCWTEAQQLQDTTQNNIYDKQFI